MRFDGICWQRHSWSVLPSHSPALTQAANTRGSFCVTGSPSPPDKYVVQLGYHLEVDATFWARHAKRARRSGEALVILHSHPRDRKVPQFSPSDDAGEAQLVPKLQARAPVAVGAVVLSPGGTQGRITEPGGSQAKPLRVAVVGDLATNPSAQITDARFDRQLRVLGQEGQAVLASTTVGVVGAGGLGSHVVQQLAHLGVGRVIVVDPDRVQSTNLSRLVGASRFDATLRRHKTTVARRLARRVGGPTRVDEVRGSVTDAEPARRLLTCDVVVGCTDNQWSRTVLNAMAFQYYLPVMDLGVELQTGGAMGGRVTWLSPGSPCLWCRGVLSAARVRAEQLPSAALQDELARGYLEGIDEPAPAVVSINGVVASIGVTEMLARLTGFSGPDERADQLIYRIADGTVRRTSQTANDTCPTCSSKGLLGRGDLARPPWQGRT
jgi:Dinucleotide-utilizing enzymes involved in molybdopterin and thiamine biosynthesis family 2